MSEAFEKWGDKKGYNPNGCLFNYGDMESSWNAALQSDQYWDYGKACFKRGQEVAAPQWLSIEAAPKDEEVWFWLVPLDESETFYDTSNNAILTKGKPHGRLTKYGHWGSLWKATHWQLKPEPPEP